MHDPEIPIVLIERDAGQRLYDRDLRRYITVDDLHAWQLMSVPFIVRDAESGEDVTAAMLLEPSQTALTGAAKAACCVVRAQPDQCHHSRRQ